MSDTLVLLLLCIAMLFGCYTAGLVPLSISLSEEKLTLISTLGAGLLVGTALAVIIPEGVNAIYTAVPHNDATHESEHHEHQHTALQTSSGVELHTAIGVTLVLGFVFMLLVDQFSRRSKSSSDLDAVGRTENVSQITATVGLVVHAAADGVALGAAATSTHREIEIIVFFAIMLHKAPAAFALVTFLMHEGLERSRIKRHLVAFSLAAPVLAITTFLGLSQSTKETMASVNATGVALLFSAGTFLYVATVHVLPEITHGAGHHHYSNVCDPEKVPPPAHAPGLSRKQLLALVFGCILPVFFSMGHSHH